MSDLTKATEQTRRETQRAAREIAKTADHISEVLKAAAIQKVNIRAVTIEEKPIVEVIMYPGHARKVAPPGQEYVDPYLFETGHFESREEYEELSRTAKIKPRAKA